MYLCVCVCVDIVKREDKKQQRAYHINCVVYLRIRRRHKCIIYKKLKINRFLN